ncbi:DNA cytosine methyltransferase [Pseudomonas sp. MUP55]|uniref:DNA cytosine methyltransferase n=1 Tax=Pseudomonas sp. MUP55 TaxID=3087234 RepID=UPI002A59A38D|nr:MULTISPECIES: DNA cytosine methyltransferase [unclassified Pseudomonas]WPN90326.1 DNA cytosine methyltransferase [Pseudomonas sp. MUP56]WPN95851.1 DNA cytosine methyltransferase [Pseudomonas sp. MUP55]
MPIIYGSVCSGIEAATQAWHPQGMRAAWFAEIEPFPSAVLAHHYPNVPNHGDMIKLAALVLAGKIPAPDVLVGGTPCQAFSVAGMREGLTDPRGALTIKYVELADAVDYVRAGQRKPASVIVWENVPGVLSDKGNAFGCFLGALAGEDCELQPPGKKWQDAGCVYGPKRTIAWRVLDAQYFGLAQRRRRVFVVASARDGFDPTEVLFEREGVRRDTAPRRGEGQDVTGTAPFGPALQCGCGSVFAESLGQYGCPNCEGDEGPAVSMFGGIPAFGGHGLEGSVERSATLTAKDTRLDVESETFFVAPTLAGGGRKSGGYSLDDIPLTAPALRAQAQSSHRADSEAFIVAGTLQASGKAAGSATQQDAESGLLVVHGTQDPGVSDSLAFALGRNNGAENAVLAFSCKDHGADAGFIAPTLRAMGHSGSHANAGGQVAVCITGDITHTLKPEVFDGSEDGTGRGQPIVECRDVAQTLTSNYGKQVDNTDSSLGPNVVSSTSAVRRLTPRECERLQGFPDDYTRIPWRGRVLGLCPDGPRYKAIGNSKAVTVVRWIGRRLLRQLAN